MHYDRRRQYGRDASLGGVSLQMLNMWIKNIVLIILFATFIELLLPNNNYKKFVKVIMGLLVLQAVLQPVLDLFNNPWREAAVQGVTARAVVEKTGQITNQSTKLQGERDRLVLEQYRRELSKQVQVLAMSVAGVADVGVNISLNEQKDDKSYGAIKVITLTAKAEQTVKGPTSVEPVKRVEVSGAANKLTVGLSVDESTKEHIKKVISEFYHLRTEQVIVIDWQDH